MIRRILKCLSLLIAVTGIFTNCSSSNNDEPTPTPELRIVSVSNTGEIPAAGGRYTVNVSAPSLPDVSINASWITRGNANKTGSVFVMEFDVEANTSAARTATITFKCGSASVTQTVTQADGTPEPEPEPEIPVDPTLPVISDVPMLGLGWNLGNHFDAHNNGVAGETAWGNPKATQGLFNKLRADGWTSVRIPVTYLGKVGEGPDYTIDADWLNRVYEVVGYAETAGLKVVINIHHDGADSKYWLEVKQSATDATKRAEMIARFKAMWTQIANKFKDKGDFLMFEPFNELHDGGWGWGANRTDGGKQYAVVNELNQAFVDAVRATGGNNTQRWLGAVGYCTNPDLTMDNLVLPTDPTAGRLMVGVHFYDPTAFTLEAKYTTWGHTGKPGNKETWGDEDNVRNVFNKLYEKYVKNGIPVYIGEGGCTHFANSTGETYRKYYLEYVAKAARVYGMSYFIWDNGSTSAGNEAHGYYNHGNGAYINNSGEIVPIINNAYFNTDPNYTLNYIYANAPQ